MNDPDPDDDIAAIQRLPRFRDSSCSACNTPLRVHVLQTYKRCPACGTELKCRALGGIGTEIQDVVDAVLQWAGIPREEIIHRHEMAASKKKGRRFWSKWF